MLFPLYLVNGNKMRQAALESKGARTLPSVIAADYEINGVGPTRATGEESERIPVSGWSEEARMDFLLHLTRYYRAVGIAEWFC